MLSKIKFKTILPILIVILVSLSFIFYKFNIIPEYLNFDEIDFAKLALSLKNMSYIPYTPMATGHSTLYFYLILLSFEVFGINNFALRFPAAIFGVMSVILFYFVTKKKFLKPSFIPLALTIIFLTSRWFLNFARFSFETTFLLFLELMSIYFLIKNPYKDTGLNLIISGIFAGLAFNSYTPGRIFFVLPLLFLISNVGKIDRFTIIKQLVLFIVPFILISIPISAYFLKHKDVRFEQQFYFSKTKLTSQAKLNYLVQNIQNTFLMFSIKGDMNGRHNFPGKPALNPILSIFFVSGLILTLKNYRNRINKFFLVYFVLSLLPTLFTNPAENPNMLRTFTVLPSVIYFIGNIFSYIQKKRSVWLSFTVFLFLIFSSIYELRTYFLFQSRVFRNSFEVKCPIEKLINKNRPYPKECLVSRNEF